MKKLTATICTPSIENCLSPTSLMGKLLLFEFKLFSFDNNCLASTNLLSASPLVKLQRTWTLLSSKLQTVSNTSCWRWLFQFLKEQKTTLVNCIKWACRNYWLTNCPQKMPFLTKNMKEKVGIFENTMYFWRMTSW